MQNINIPAEDKDIEAVVSNVILSRFPEVHFLLESFYKFLVNYALLSNDVMIDEFIGDLWAPLSVVFQHFILACSTSMKLVN